MKQQRTLGIMMLTGLLLLAGFTSNALAWVSAACDPISNQATLSYSVAGIAQTDISSDDPNTGASGDSTTFYVGTLVDLTMTVVSTPVNAAGTDQVLAFTIKNDGNDTQRYGLQLYEGVDSTDDQFDMNNVSVYFDTASTYNSATATLVEADVAAGSGFGNTLAVLTDNVAPGSTIYVYVVSDVPANQAAGDKAAYTLKALTYQIDSSGFNGADGNQGTETGNSAIDATSNNCATGGDTGVVPVDGDADGTFTAVGGASDGPNDGDYFATGEYIVITSALSVKKTATILWDPVNGNTAPVAIPGAYIRYSIAIENAAGASASATLDAITDQLQVANLAFDPVMFTGADLDPSDGPYASGSATPAKGFHAVVTGSSRSSGTDVYYTTASDADGIEWDGTDTITASFATVLPVNAGGSGYTAGELKAGETVTITFNAIVK